MADDLHPNFPEPADRITPENHRIRAEWEAWRQVTRQVRALMPEKDDVALAPLVLAVQQWGEELHALRLRREHRVELVRARDAYRPHHIGD